MAELAKHIRTAPMVLWELALTLGYIEDVPQETIEQTLNWAKSKCEMFAESAASKVRSLGPDCAVNEPGLPDVINDLKAAMMAWGAALSVDSGGTIGELARHYVANVMPDPMVPEYAASPESCFDDIEDIICQAQCNGKFVAVKMPNIEAWFEWLGRDIVNEAVQWEREQHPSWSRPESDDDTSYDVDIPDDGQIHDDYEGLLVWLNEVLTDRD